MARRRPPTVHGMCIVDKPSGMTSHDVVGLLRRRFGERQIGHAGTLDPDATGVLVVAVGMATRLLQFATATSKRYTGEVVLGTSTSTLDASGEVTGVFDMVHVTEDDVRRVVHESLLGEIQQIPPMVSAIRVDGRRLHELARDGIEIDRKPRPVTVHEFSIGEISESGVIQIAVTCSPGTYIRTLAADLGELLGGGAHLRGLRRVASGLWTEHDAKGPDECELLPVERMVDGLTRVDVDNTTVPKIGQGAVLPTWDTPHPWAVFADDTLVAVYEPFRDGTAKPIVVLPTALNR